MDTLISDWCVDDALHQIGRRTKHMSFGSKQIEQGTWVLIT